MGCNCGGGCGNCSPCSGLASGQNEVNTPNCTSALGVNTSVCGPNSQRQCACSNCGCDQAGACTPTPYYLQAQGCQENHNQLLINNRFALAIKTVTAFAVPACNPPSSVTVYFPDVNYAAVGGYLYAPSLNLYLKILAFDPINHTLILQNDMCRTDAAAPGTVVPACTAFQVANVVAPASNNTDSLYPYLEENMTAPAVGVCIDPLLVTTSIGLAVGNVVVIGGGQYTVAAINSPTSIKICNDTGNGLPSGTVVIAHDSGGNHIVPIIQVNKDACTNPIVQTGSLLVCHDGVQQPLDAAMEGMIPVVVNATTNEVQMKFIDIPVAECTNLDENTCLTLHVGTADYTIEVVDSSIFHNGDVLHIVYDNVEYIFTITNVVSIHTVNIHLDSPTLTTTVPIPCGSLVCKARCCEQLQAQIDIINTTINTTIPQQITCSNKLVAYGGIDNTYNTFDVMDGVDDPDPNALHLPRYYYANKSLDKIPEGNVLSVTVPEECAGAYIINAYVQLEHLSAFGNNNTNPLGASSGIVHDFVAQWAINGVRSLNFFQRMTWTHNEPLLSGYDANRPLLFAYNPFPFLAPEPPPIWAHLVQYPGVTKESYNYQAGMICVPCYAVAGDVCTLHIQYRLGSTYDMKPTEWVVGVHHVYTAHYGRWELMKV